MSAIKNGIKELHCKESLSGKRFKRSIAHNNLKLTCNIYHIQVFKLPFLQIGLYKIASTDSGDEFSSLLNSVLIRMLKVMHSQKNRFKVRFCLVSRLISYLLSCASCRGLRLGGERRSTRVEREQGSSGSGGDEGEVRWEWDRVGCP